MTVFLHRGAGRLAVFAVALCLAATGALARTQGDVPSAPVVAAALPDPGPPDAEREALGASLAQKFLAAMDFNRTMEKSFSSERFADLAKMRPEWPAMISEAVVTTIEESPQEIANLMGRFYAATFSTGELRSAVAYLQTPGGAAFLNVMHETAMGRPRPALSPEDQAALNRMRATPDGAAFFNRLAASKATANSFATDFMVVVLPKAMRRFGEKADAAEAARQAAAGAQSASDRAGAELSAVLMDSLDLPGLMAKANLSDVQGFDARAEWTPILKAAFADALVERRPQIDRAVGHAFAGYFTLAELKAGISMFSSPAGRALMRQLSDRQAGRPTPPLSRATQVALDRFGKTKIGASFAVKFSNVQVAFRPAMQDVSAIMFADAIRLFGARTEALEASRRPAT
jgi:hypothetical protein